MYLLKDSINDFLFHCKYEKGLSEKTQKFYKIDLLQFENFLVLNAFSFDVGEIDKESLRLYLQSISKFKPKTIKRKIATLKALFNYLEFEDKILVSPFRKLRIKIKEPMVLPKALNNNEMKAIFKAVYSANDCNISKQNYSYFENKRDIAVIEMLFATGIRVSELVGLRTENVDLKCGQIKVNGKGSKERIMQICNPEILLALNKYRHLSKQRKNNLTEYFFINRLGKQLSDQSVRSIVKKYSKIAKINTKVTPHVFRHTFATLLLENDVDIKYIQSFLGHSSIAITQIYTHVSKAKQRKIVQLKHPRKDFSM